MVVGNQKKLERMMASGSVCPFIANMSYANLNMTPEMYPIGPMSLRGREIVKRHCVIGPNNNNPPGALLLIGLTSVLPWGINEFCMP